MTDRASAQRLATLGIQAAHKVNASRAVAHVRAAALVDIATTAAALARALVLAHHLDPRHLSTLVTAAGPGDVTAVLGRGAWLPTTTRLRPPPATPVKRAPARRSTRRAPEPPEGQLVLFTTTTTTTRTTTKTSTTKALREGAR